MAFKKQWKRAKVWMAKQRIMRYAKVPRGGFEKGSSQVMLAEALAKRLASLGVEVNDAKRVIHGAYRQIVAVEIGLMAKEAAINPNEKILSRESADFLKKHKNDPEFKEALSSEIDDHFKKRFYKEFKVTDSLGKTHVFSINARKNIETGKINWGFTEELE